MSLLDLKDRQRGRVVQKDEKRNRSCSKFLCPNHSERLNLALSFTHTCIVMQMIPSDSYGSTLNLLLLPVSTSNQNFCRWCPLFNRKKTSEILVSAHAFRLEEKNDLLKPHLHFIMATNNQNFLFIEIPFLKKCVFFS